MACTYELAHIGINTENAEEAKKTAELFCSLFNLNFRNGNKSEFAGAYFECMKSPYLGKNGHIAMKTPDVAAAVEELKAKGCSFLEETAQYTEDGILKNIYIDGEFAGFAVHVLRA